MSYVHGFALQSALFDALSADSALVGVVGPRIYDEAPLAVPEGAYLVLGDEQVSPWSTASDAGAAHELAVTVFSPARGFAELKRAAAAICDVALGPLAVEGARVAFSSFLGGRTRRPEAGLPRRIELRFRIALEAA